MVITTEDARRVLDSATARAAERSRTVTAVDCVVALLQDPTVHVGNVALLNCGLSVDAFDQVSCASGVDIDALVAQAHVSALSIGDRYVGPHHLLLALFQCESSRDEMADIMTGHGVSENSVRAAVLDLLGRDRGGGP
ncbi:MAG: Clp protease N-terminal domain-containing protein [Thermomicrobiales bacterium]